MISKGLEYLLTIEQINSSLLKKAVLTENPDWLNDLISGFKRENYCHFNAMKLVEVLNSKIPVGNHSLQAEIKYVLGLIAGLDVHEHAFIKIGSNYYDPANNQSMREYEVYSLLELNHKELMVILNKHNMHEHGLLMMTLRNDPDYCHLFSSGFDKISRDIKDQLNSYMKNEASMKHNQI